MCGQRPDVYLVVTDLAGGGVGHATRSQATILHNTGHKVTILTTHENVTADKVDNEYALGKVPREVPIRNLQQELGTRPPEFANDYRWAEGWVEAILGSARKGSVIVANYPAIAQMIGRANLPGIRKLWVLHNNVFDAPDFTPTSAVRANYARGLESARDLDGLLILTQQEFDDMTTHVRPMAPMYVVPNSTAVLPEPHTQRDPNLVVAFGRFEPQKAFPEAIRTFKLVVAQRPEARLEIYGRGKLRHDLKALIESEGLSNSVIMKSYTKNPHGVMARAMCMMMTSDYEGQPLVILESHMMKTPLATYAYRYGPETMIEDGVNGRVVPWRDRQALANAVIDLLDRPETVEAMGTVARQRAIAEYSPEVIAKAWIRVFRKVKLRSS
jgi:glycosyltransferase involved in cell wall biosynthesis